MPLSAQNLSGGYDQALIIQGINLDVRLGEWLSIIGANGSGKSTLLKLLSRILKPQTGQVCLDGKSIHDQPSVAIAQKLAILPQQQLVPMGITVRQLVSLGRSPHQPWWQWELDGLGQEVVSQALTQTKLENFSDRPVSELSGGERQRAFLAMALAQSPQILLLDEPTTYLDLRYQLELLELLKDLNQNQGLTIITVLHEINLAARYSDRLALIKSGEIMAIAPPIQVLTPELLRRCFDLEVMIMDTPVGVQICAICPSSAPS
mgnify:CR=1 FL=1